MSESVEILPIKVPAPGETVAVADGVYWLRMPLPFELDHINLWLLEDDDGWTIVDAGVKSAAIEAHWRTILTPRVAAKPVKRLVCTHCHPDHLGLAGWLRETWGAELWIAANEWEMGRRFGSIDGADPALYRAHYVAAGCGDADTAAAIDHVCGAYRHYSAVPERYRRLRDGDALFMAGRAWSVMVAHGHSVEHACLYCAELSLLIGGDQFLPKITPAILLQPTEPEANPLREFLDSNRRFADLPGDVRVLPSHNLPFAGLSARIAEYERHHADRLDAVLDACATPAGCTDVARRLFTRPFKGRATFFAIGETLSHIRYLVDQGLVERAADRDGIARYVRA